MYPSEGGEVLRPRPFSFLSASRVALILVALILMLAASAVGVQASTPSQARTLTIAQVDGGPHYYGQFSHPLPDNPHYFPIMAWLRKTEQQSDIDAYVDFGLNGLVGVENPEGAQETLLRQAGLHVIIQADERTRFDDLGTETKGWILGDEQDMQLGPTACPSAVNAVKAGLPDDGRLRFNGYGKGVLEWETDDEAKCWLQQQDVSAADLYWFTDPGKSAQRFGYLYGDNVSRLRYLRALGGGSPEPIWMDVELGWPFTESANAGWTENPPGRGSLGGLALDHRRRAGDHLLRPQLRARHAREHDPGRRVPGHEGDDEVRERADHCACPSAQLPDGRLRLVAGGRDNHDGEVGRGRQGQQEAL